ncbi:MULTISPECIES: hypothetical protein [unclassified Vibrio]|uniref:Tail fiber assembly protein n=1 Tax=Vibrio sp. HB236076 TaxID=3232307 RepID=A0AB39HCU9_9VIBR|nr:hypothetical protein [Vibrio sp. HB161653]MDP5253381.1 hypothetical protein [Vibrio sp. HB161653]
MNDAYGLLKTKEVHTVYFRKSNLMEYQIFPAPKDLENWYLYETNDLSEVGGMMYDPSTGTLVSTPTPTEDTLRWRKEAYQQEADPLYLDAQFDIATGRKTAEEALQPWIAKVAEIKERFPLPNE